MDAVTECDSWATGDSSARVRCRSAAGKPIQLCGHGLLCTAMAWRLREQPVTRLEMNGQAVRVDSDGTLIWAGFSTAQCTPLAVPGWTAGVFSTQPWRAAVSGEEDAYLVLEWPAGYALETLPVPRVSLAQITRRAIIVTCIDDGPRPIDVRLRYFAPQHGVAEDAATGSAMRILASYWRARGLADELTAEQCSSSGGLLRSRIDARLTWIGGRVVHDEGPRT